MKKLNMTRLVLAILALVGFTAGQAASTLQNYNEGWPEAPQVQDSETQPWKNWIDKNQGYDVAQQPGFERFTPEQQDDLVNYQNASQGGMQNAAQQNLPNQGYGDDEWTDDEDEVGDGDLTSAQLQDWKDFITQHKLTTVDLEREPNYQNLNSTEQKALSLYAELQRAGVSAYPTTATNSPVSSATSTTSVDPEEEPIVKQWIQYYIKEKGYTGLKLRNVQGFSDFSAAAQTQLLNAANSKSNTSNNWEDVAKKGAQLVANTEVGQKFQGMANDALKNAEPEFYKGLNLLVEKGFKKGFKWLGIDEQLPMTSSQVVPGGQNQGVLTRPVEYGPQPAQPGPGSLYQPGYGQSPQVTPGTFNQFPTGRAGMAPPPPPAKKDPAISHSGTQLPTTPTTGSDGLAPLLSDSEIGQLPIAEQKPARVYRDIAKALKANHKLNFAIQPGWTKLAAQPVYNQISLERYQQQLLKN